MVVTIENKYVTYLKTFTQFNIISLNAIEAINIVKNVDNIVDAI